MTVLFVSPSNDSPFSPPLPQTVGNILTKSLVHVNQTNDCLKYWYCGEYSPSTLRCDFTYYMILEYLTFTDPCMPSVRCMFQRSLGQWPASVTAHVRLLADSQKILNIGSQRFFMLSKFGWGRCHYWLRIAFSAFLWIWRSVFPLGVAGNWRKAFML